MQRVDLFVRGRKHHQCPPRLCEIMRGHKTTSVSSSCLHQLHAHTFRSECVCNYSLSCSCFLISSTREKREETKIFPLIFFFFCTLKKPHHLLANKRPVSEVFLSHLGLARLSSPLLVSWSLYTVVKEARMKRALSLQPHRDVSWRKTVIGELLLITLFSLCHPSEQVLFFSPPPSCKARWWVQAERHFCNLYQGCSKCFFSNVRICLLSTNEERGGGEEGGSHMWGRGSVQFRLFRVTAIQKDPLEDRMRSQVWGDPWQI